MNTIGDENSAEMRASALQVLASLRSASPPQYVLKELILVEIGKSNNATE